jgi:hypothetical protein
VGWADFLPSRWDFDFGGEMRGGLNARKVHFKVALF